MGDKENKDSSTECDSGVFADPRAKRHRFVVQQFCEQEQDDEAYRPIKEGKAIIFNHKFYKDNYEAPRPGTDVDVEELKKVLPLFNFSITVHTDFTRRQIRDELDNLRTANFNNCDCLAIFVLTHGKENSLAAQDNHYRTDELWDNISSIKCPSMAGKPKLVFINACRGDGQEIGIELVKNVLTTDGPQDDNNMYQLVYTVPNFADILVAFSTFEGYVSHRHPSKGTWFIQSLCEALKDENINKMEIRNILTRVTRMVALKKHEKYRTKQVPVVLSTLIRDLFLK